MDIAKLAIEVDASQATAAAGQLKAFGAEAVKADKAATGVGIASATAGKEAGNSAYKYRMAAMQLSQVASQGSVTGNYIQALAIQLPDLAMGLGTVGIVAGALAGALAMPLIDALRGTSKSVDDLIDDVARLAGQFDEAADGSYKLSEELVRIARVSQEAARLRLRIDTEQAKESLEGVRSAMADTLAEGLSVGRQSFGLAGIIERGGLSAALGPDLRSLRATTKLTYEELNNLGSAADAARGSLDPKAYSQLALVVDNLKEKYGESNETVNILSSGLAEQIPLAIEAAQTVSRLADATDNFDAMLVRSSDDLQTLATQMTMFNSGAFGFDDWLSEQLEADDARLASRRQSASQIAQIEAGLLDDRSKLAFRQLDIYSQIEAAEQRGVLSTEQANALKLASDQQYAEQSYAIALQQQQQQLQLNASMIASAQNLSANLLAALEAYGAESSALGMVAIAVQKGLMVAQAIMAAEIAAVQTQAAYAGLAAATNNPLLVPAGTAHAQVVRAMGYASAALIAATEFAPARALGGQVTAGTTYLVGERGPELVTMGANGYVTPNDKLGGKSAPVINVIEDASRAGTQETQQMGEQDIVNIFVANIQRGGAAARALQGAYGLRRAGR